MMTQDPKSSASSKSGHRHAGHHHEKQHGPKPATEQEKETTARGQGKETAEERKLAEISADLHEEVLRERDEYLEALQRLQAEFANFRKRVLRDSEQQGKRATSEVVEDLLPVLDNFERAMEAAVKHDEKLLTSGVEFVYNQLREILTRRGLCEIEAEGSAFDPTRHEAVLCQPSGEHDEGTVMQVLEKGYQLGEKVVRPAKVIVSTTPDEEASHGKGSGSKSS